MITDDAPAIDAEPRVRSRLTAEEFMIACEAGAFGDAHVELVDGEIVEMPPEGPGHAIHNFQTGRVLDRIVQRFPQLDIASNMAVVLTSDRVVGPDMVVFERSPGPISTVTGTMVRLAVEHAWSSRSYDLNRKADLYAGGGVPEYWVLDNQALVLHRFHTPRQGRYTREPPLGLDDRVAAPFAPGETVRVGELFRAT